MLNRHPWEHQETEESNDETWIVSYADMVTLLFGFFVILFSFSTMDEKKFEQMGEKLASAFKAEQDAAEAAAGDAGVSNETRQIRALQLLVAMLNLGESVDEAVAKIERAAGDEASAKAVKEFLSERIGKAGPLKLVAPSGDGVDTDLVDLVLPDTSLFAAGSAELTPEAQKKMRALAAELRLAPGVRSIEIVGHTDSVPPGPRSPYKNNFTLSSLRAGAVAEALMNGGVKSELLSVRGMGSLKPLVPERDAQGHLLPGNQAKNRRVHVVLRKLPHAAH